MDLVQKITNSAAKHLTDTLYARQRKKMFGKERHLIAEYVRLMVELMPREEILKHILSPLCTISLGSDSEINVGSVDKLHVAIAEKKGKVENEKSFAIRMNCDTTAT